MKVNVETPGFDADVKLIQFIEKRLTKLEHFYDRITHVDVFLRVEKTKPANKLIEVLVNVPGDEFMCKKMAKSFEEGVDLCAESLERVVKKHKQKIRAKA